jgi:hypothetical protein
MNSVIFVILYDFFYKTRLSSNFYDKNTSMLFEHASLQFFGATEICFDWIFKGVLQIW